MTDRSRAIPSPARYGLTHPRAEQELRDTGLWTADGPEPGSESVLGALSRSPDPDLALRGLDRLRVAVADEWPVLARELRADPGLRGRLLAVLGSSTALTDFLVANPEQWHRLTTTGYDDLRDEPGGDAAAEASTPLAPPVATGATPTEGEQPEPGLAQGGVAGEVTVRGRFTRTLLNAVRVTPASPGSANTPDPASGRAGGGFELARGTAAVSALRAAYRGELLLIAAADLGHLVEAELVAPSYDEVSAWLSDLADAALRAALAVAFAEHLSLIHTAPVSSRPAGWP